MPSEKVSIVNLKTQISESVSSSFHTPNIDFQFPDKVIEKVQELFNDESIKVNLQNVPGLKQIQDQKRSEYQHCVKSLLKACLENDL